MLEFIFKYWLELVFGLLISLVGHMYKKFKDHYKLLTATRTGLVVLLKAKIIEEYSEYKKTKKVSIYEREMIEELYEEYKKLGGNGLIGKIVEEIEDIKIEKCAGGD